MPEASEGTQCGHERNRQGAHVALSKGTEQTDMAAPSVFFVEGLMEGMADGKDDGEHQQRGQQGGEGRS